MSILTPRKYQLEGIEYLREKRRAMLIDNAGLGKTLQASMAATKPVLVACPTYLMDQWGTFLQNQFPGDTIEIAEGTRLKRQTAIFERATWTIINIEMLRSYLFPLDHYKTVIIDESHNLRSRSSQQAQRSLELLQYIPNVYFLTATPIFREADDLFMQLRILYPDEFKSFQRFMDIHCKVVTTPYGIKIIGGRESLKQLLKKYALGRTYQEVGLELPAEISTDIDIKFTDAHLRQYRDVKNTWRLEHIPFEHISQVTMLLRRMCLVQEKLDALQHTLEQAKMPTLIFTWLRETAQVVNTVVDGTLITGAMESGIRVRAAKKSHMVVATIASIQAGVDLSHMKRVIFFEDDHVYGSMYQALRRVIRATDDLSPVLVYHLHMTNSIDSIIHKLSSKRGVRAQDVLEVALR